MWQGSLRCEQPCRQVSGRVVREATATRSWRLSAVTLWWVPLVWQERRTAAGLQLRDRLAWADGWFVCALAVFSSLLILDPNTQVTWGGAGDKIRALLFRWSYVKSLRCVHVAFISQSLSCGISKFPLIYSVMKIFTYLLFFFFERQSSLFFLLSQW